MFPRSVVAGRGCRLSSVMAVLDTLLSGSTMLVILKERSDGRISAWHGVSGRAPQCQDEILRFAQDDGFPRFLNHGGTERRCQTETLRVPLAQYLRASVVKTFPTTQPKFMRPKRSFSAA